jgi:hypothetical protein
MSLRLVKAKQSRLEEQVATRIITNAQMKALKATPLSLIAAPGTGWAIVVDRVYMTSSAAAGAWTETADNPVIEYTGGTDILVIESTGFLDQASVQVRTQAIAATVTTPVINEGVRIYNPDDELGGGNAGSSFRISVIYRIMRAA